MWWRVVVCGGGGARLRDARMPLCKVDRNRSFTKNKVVSRGNGFFLWGLCVCAFGCLVVCLFVCLSVCLLVLLRGEGEKKRKTRDRHDVVYALGHRASQWSGEGWGGRGGVRVFFLRLFITFVEGWVLFGKMTAEKNTNMNIKKKALLQKETVFNGFKVRRLTCARYATLMPSSKNKERGERTKGRKKDKKVKTWLSPQPRDHQLA